MRDYTERERFLLWLNFVVGSNVKPYYGLLELFDNDPCELFKACAAGKLPSSMYTSEYEKRLYKNANLAFIDKCMARLDEQDISVTTFESDDYPELLKEIYDPPSALYYRGRLFGHIPLPISVIGTRKPTPNGLKAAFEIAAELSRAGATVVSGMALGLDCQASMGALSVADNAYPTIAVLGSGVDVIYPAKNSDAYHKIIERGAIVSEYYPHTAPDKAHFPARNRIISGISRGLLVVEAGKHSGTSITADFALDQGRDLFAMPGRADDPMCMGTNQLLHDGVAKLVLSANDILEEYGISLAMREPAKETARSEPAAAPKFDYSCLSNDEKRICEMLAAGEKSFDDLCELTGYPPSELNSILTTMSFSEIIKQSPGRIYGLK